MTIRIMQDTANVPVKLHTYRISVEWTGDRGLGTTSYSSYGRDHTITAGAKPPIAGSADLAFRGDVARWNPEELLLASLSACHKLWYLHLCATSAISVILYRDEAEATMVEESEGAGRFVSAVLRPRIVVQVGSDISTAIRLHHDAHKKCFIANSVNFPVTCEPHITAADASYQELK